jgi:hypothetical protein
MWWITNEVYWLNYGCQRTTDAGATEWVRPCPAHGTDSADTIRHDTNRTEPNLTGPAPVLPL